jgi:hypothetical protein
MSIIYGATAVSWSTLGWYLPEDCHISRYRRLNLIFFFILIARINKLRVNPSKQSFKDNPVLVLTCDKNQFIVLICKKKKIPPWSIFLST